MIGRIVPRRQLGSAAILRLAMSIQSSEIKG
jgi:hypothetical protein